MIKLLKDIPRLWNSFWFESNEALHMDLFRRLLGLVLFCCYSIRTLDLKFFYSESGFLPASRVNEAIAMEGRYSLLLWFSSDTALWVCHIIFLLSLLAMVFKFFPRIASIIALIMHLSFMHRTMIISYGIDLISVFFLFFQCFADTRVRAIRGDSNLQKGQDWRSTLGSVAFRLSQIQLCIIYAYGGCHKLKGSHWWSGEAVWDMMANAQLTKVDVTWLSHYPSVIILMTFSALIWEIYFPVLVWIKPIKPYVLLFGVAMHLVILTTVDIPFFSTMMTCAFILFLERETLVKIIGKIPYIRSKASLNDLY